MLTAAARESARRSAAFGCRQRSVVVGKRRPPSRAANVPLLLPLQAAAPSSAAGPTAFWKQQQRSFSSSSYGGDSDSDDDGDDNERRTRPRRKKKALVLGSSGALGSSVARHFSTQLGAQVLGADLLELPAELTGEFELDAFCPLPRNASLEELTVQLAESVHDFVRGGDNDSAAAGLDCLVVAAGGFRADPPAAPLPAPSAPLARDDCLRQARELAAANEAMLRQNLHPVLAAAAIAAQFMNSAAVDQEGGPPPLLVVIGAAAALGPTPGTLGYGCSKAAAHHVAQTLGSMTGHGEVNRAMKKQARQLRRHLPSLDHLDVVAILPTVLDTPANRQAMSSGVRDRSSWTSIPALTLEIGRLLAHPELRPHSGALVKIYNEKRPPPSGTETEGPTAAAAAAAAPQAFLELVR